MIYKIYTDGACSGNPGIGGYSCLFLNDGKVITGNKQYTTNNEMELLAVCIAIKTIVKKVKGKHRIEIYTDSAYVANSINQAWLFNWVKNGWKTKAGETVKNKQIWEDIYKYLKKYNIKIIKVKGHSNDEYNAKVDLLAKNEIKKIKALL